MTEPTEFLCPQKLKFYKRDNGYSHTESLILLRELLIVKDLWTARTVKCNNCADFQEWVTSNSLDGVEDDMFEESKF